MTWQFSQETGFTHIPSTGLMSGCVEVADSTYAALFIAQAKGAKITTDSNGSPHAVDGTGAVIDLSTVDDATSYAQQYIPTLADKAASALSSAKSYTQSEYTDYGDDIPDSWKAYLKALRDIANGTDTASTTLPTAPTT